MLETELPKAENLADLKQMIVNCAQSLGFDLIKVTSAKLSEKYLQCYDEWIADGLQASMKYMEKVEARRDISELLPGAKTVIVLATNYYREQDELKEGEGRVARYAYGRDYHKIIGKKLRKLEEFIELSTMRSGLFKATKDDGESNEAGFGSRLTKSYVDTGPILERAYAEQSGLGVIGKNGCLISREYGSWLFLSEVITQLDLPLDKAPENYNSTTVCAGCTKCIDACPTSAIIAPGVIDARLCISYLTIENKNGIPEELAQKIKETKRIYGCDICQEVCPHNLARQRITTHWEFSEPKIAGDKLSLAEEVQSSLGSDEDFLDRFAGSPLMRVKRAGLKRNLEVL